MIINLIIKPYKKKKTFKENMNSNAILIGLDKITAKSSKIFVKLNEPKNLDHSK